MKRVGQTGERSGDNLTNIEALRRLKESDHGFGALSLLHLEFVKRCMFMVPRLSLFVKIIRNPQVALYPFKALIQWYIPSFARIIEPLQIILSQLPNHSGIPNFQCAIERRQVLLYSVRVRALRYNARVAVHAPLECYLSIRAPPLFCDLRDIFIIQ